MFGRGWVAWLLSGVVVVVLSTSCSDGDGSGASKPEQTGGSDSGIAGEASGGAAAGAATTPGSLEPDPEAGGPWLGRTCRKDDECGGHGLRCLGENEGYMDGQGSPAHGICTADCAGDSDCRAFDDTAVCATLAEAPLVLAYASKPSPRLCMQGCSFGAPTGNSKCHGRMDLACRPFAPLPVTTCFKQTDVCPEGTLCFRGACREAGCGPRCNANSDCASGRFCNPFTGLCDREQPAAVPIGAECPGDNDPTSTICGAGNCLEVQVGGMHVKRMCTQSCTIGGLCGNDGACVAGRLDDYAAGDAGYCLQRCNCDQDCKNPADKCVPFGNASLEAHFTSKGVCNYAPEGATTLSCGDEGSGGAGGAGGMANAGSGGAADDIHAERGGVGGN
jgi:hypothetical protein